MAIPRKIWTFWGGNEPPEMIKECLESQRKMCEDFGYEFNLINEENMCKDSRFVNEALNSDLGNGKWCKISDFLRHYYLYTYGGIWLDSDVLVLPGKNFDAFLDDGQMLAKEGIYIAASVIGAEQFSPLEWNTFMLAESNFRGDGTWIWETGMLHYNKMIESPNIPKPANTKVYPEEYFSPYNWQTGELNITENTICIHKFMGSWSGEAEKKIKEIINE